MSSPPPDSDFKKSTLPPPATTTTTSSVTWADRLRRELAAGRVGPNWDLTLGSYRIRWLRQEDAQLLHLRPSDLVAACGGSRRLATDSLADLDTEVPQRRQQLLLVSGPGGSVVAFLLIAEEYSSDSDTVEVLYLCSTGGFGAVLQWLAAERYRATAFNQMYGIALKHLAPYYSRLGWYIASEEARSPAREWAEHKAAAEASGRTEADYVDMMAMENTQMKFPLRDESRLSRLERGALQALARLEAAAATPAPAPSPSPPGARTAATVAWEVFLGEAVGPGFQLSLGPYRIQWRLRAELTAEQRRLLEEPYLDAICGASLPPHDGDTHVLLVTCAPVAPAYREHMRRWIVREAAWNRESPKKRLAVLAAMREQLVGVALAREHREEGRVHLGRVCSDSMKHHPAERAVTRFGAILQWLLASHFSRPSAGVDVLSTRVPDEDDDRAYFEYLGWELRRGAHTTVREAVLPLAAGSPGLDRLRRAAFRALDRLYEAYSSKAGGDKP